MIPDHVKNQAIAKLKHKIPPELIASELDLPLMLVREWETTLCPNDLIALQANIQAVTTVAHAVMNGELMPDNEFLLKQELEKAAIQIAQASTKPLLIGDMMHAKAIQLCADAVAKLYQTYILKGVATGSGQSRPIGNGGFQELMKD